MKLYIVFLSVFCFNAFSSGIKSFEVYQQNPNLIENDIKKIEDLNAKNQNNLTTSALNNLKLISDYLSFNENELMMDSLISQSKEVGWKNTEVRAIELKDLCENPQTLDKTKCVEKLEELSHFVGDSNLSDSNKLAIQTFCREFKKQFLIKTQVNDDFIKEFNKNVGEINLAYFRIKPMEAEKIVAEIPKPVIVKNQGFTEIYTKYSNKIFIGFASLAGLLLISHAASLLIARHRMKSFYSTLFMAAKKGNVNLRIFGKFNYSDLYKLKKIERTLSRFINHSKVISPKFEMRIKERSNALVLDLEYFSNKSIDSILNTNLGSPLTVNFEELSKIVEQIDSELVITNKINNHGDVLKSNIIISLSH